MIVLFPTLPTLAFLLIPKFKVNNWYENLQKYLKINGRSTISWHILSLVSQKVYTKMPNT